MADPMWNCKDVLKYWWTLGSWLSICNILSRGAYVGNGGLIFMYLLRISILKYIIFRTFFQSSLQHFTIYFILLYCFISVLLLTLLIHKSDKKITLLMDAVYHQMISSWKTLLLLLLIIWFMGFFWRKSIYSTITPSVVTCSFAALKSGLYSVFFFSVVPWCFCVVPDKW